MSLALRTTVVGSWPPEDRFRPELQRYFRGELAERDADELLRAMAAVAISQQRGLDLDVYTGGETSADSFVLHFARRLSGVRPSSNPEAWDGRGAYEVVDTIAAPRGLGIAEAFRREQVLAPELFKVTLPGPSELTTQLQPADARRGCWPAVMRLLRVEIAELIVAGAREIQLDLPQIAMGLADGGWETEEAVDVIGELLAGLPAGTRRSVHLCYGDFGARTWTRNRALGPLLPLLQRLDGLVDCVVLELSLPEQWAERDKLTELPPRLEVAAGVVDVKTPRIQSSDELARMAEDLLRLLPAERLWLCPSCGLGRRTVPLAMAKVSAMVHAARLLKRQPHERC